MFKISAIICALSLLFIQGISAQTNSQNKEFSFFAIGDMPYGGADEEAKFLNLIKTINKEKSAFTIHAGDFKSGSTLCSNEYYQKMLGYFGQFDKPMIYTPGDNEWTDCNRPACGNYDSEERLAYLRKHFFSTTKSFGKQTIDLVSERNTKGFEKFVENNRWEYRNVTFATLHVVGSNNNILPNQPNKEFYERDSANVYWLNETFRLAALNKSTGIVITLQADMFRPEGDKGFTHLKDVLKKLAVEFKKPVLLINGDSHALLIDKPFTVGTDKKHMYVVPNFTRLQVFGEADVHAVKVTVNPVNPNLFEINAFFIPGN